MVRHIVAWNFQEGRTPEQNQSDAQKIQKDVEALRDLIPGVVSLHVRINLLASSNRQFVLDSLFSDKAALAAYQVHPEHQRVGAFIGSVARDRVCVDFLEP